MTVSIAFANASLDASLVGTYYVALTVGGVEVSGSAYARTAVTWAASTSGHKKNNADVVFPRATGGAWGSIDGWALFSASTGGTALFTGVVSPSVVIADGTQFTFVTGSVDVTLT